MNYDDIVVGICWYDDPSIFRLLDSLPQQVRKIVVDGRFKWNPSGRELSSFKLRKKVRSYDNVTLIDAPDLLEPDKRNVYLEAMTGYRYGLMLDSDEYIDAADWPNAMSQMESFEDGIHHITFIIDSHGGYTLYPRLWVNPSDWRYHECHCVFKNQKTGETLRSGFKKGRYVSTIFCKSDDTQRSSTWVENTYQYQKKLIAYEKPLREKY